jgi:tetratricopeptide (TPR) repeat protein
MNLMRHFTHLPLFMCLSCLWMTAVSSTESSAIFPANTESGLSEIAQNRNNDIEVRVQALLELGQYDGKNALIAIARATRDSEPALREGAILAVEDWADIARWDVVSPLIQDGDKNVRQQAVRVLLPLWAQLNQQQQIYMNSAIKGYLEHLAQLPPNIENQLTIANVYLVTAQYGQAEERYKTLVEHSSKNLRVYLELSELYRLQGDNQAAIKLLVDAINLLPADDRLHYTLSLAYIRNKDNATAIKQMKLAITLAENKSAYQFVLAMIVQDKEPKQAISLLETVIKKTPSPQYEYALCKLYIEQQMFTDASACVKGLENKIPKKVFLQLNEKLKMANDK